LCCWAVVWRGRGRARGGVEWGGGEEGEAKRWLQLDRDIIGQFLIGKRDFHDAFYRLPRFWIVCLLVCFHVEELVFFLNIYIYFLFLQIKTRTGKAWRRRKEGQEEKATRKWWEQSLKVNTVNSSLTDTQLLRRGDRVPAKKTHWK